MSVEMNAVSNRDIMNRFFRKLNHSEEISENCQEADSCAAGRANQSVVTNREEGETVNGQEIIVGPELFLAIVRAIPESFHSKDLRRYFADFVEDEKFDCFHFRHRPEISTTSEEVPSTSKALKRSTRCCVVRFRTMDDRSEFVQEFHGRAWTDEEGRQISRRCAVYAIKLLKDNQETPCSSSSSLSESDAANLIELRPPLEMPQGNVGTPTRFFLEKIRACTLPSSLIKKLGLKSVRRRRKYDAVPGYYDGCRRGQGLTTYLRKVTTGKELNGKGNDDERDPTALQSPQPEDPTDAAMRNDFGPDNDDLEHEDNDECEEWERHEALHDDVTEHERTKEKRFEEEMEVTWEKGGPGLVWEMDKGKWDAMEKGTDCDWAWADDWDVDYSVYYEGKGAGDVDSRQAVEMREDDAKRRGDLMESVFSKKKAEQERRHMRKGGRPSTKNEKAGNDNNVVNEIMKKSGDQSSVILTPRGLFGLSLVCGRMGWSSGEGLGSQKQGRVHPVAVDLEEEGQLGRERKGVGWHGEKMQRHGLEKRRVPHAIPSVFDDEERKEFKRNKKNEILWRREDKTADNIRTSKSVTSFFKLIE